MKPKAPPLPSASPPAASFAAASFSLVRRQLEARHAGLHLQSGHLVERVVLRIRDVRVPVLGREARVTHEVALVLGLSRTTGTGAAVRVERQIGVFGLLEDVRERPLERGHGLFDGFLGAFLDGRRRRVRPKVSPELQHSFRLGPLKQLKPALLTELKAVFDGLALRQQLRVPTDNGLRTLEGWPFRGRPSTVDCHDADDVICSFCIWCRVLDGICSARQYVRYDVAVDLKIVLNIKSSAYNIRK